MIVIRINLPSLMATAPAAALVAAASVLASNLLERTELF
jgi:hypothetical protein